MSDLIDALLLLAALAGAALLLALLLTLTVGAWALGLAELLRMVVS